MITQANLAEALIEAGIVQRAAIEDPVGYDGGDTERAVLIAAQRLDHIVRIRAVVVGHEKEKGQ